MTLLQIGIQLDGFQINVLGLILLGVLLAVGLFAMKRQLDRGLPWTSNTGVMTPCRQEKDGSCPTCGRPLRGG